jgi:hypothetical protein
MDGSHVGPDLPRLERGLTYGLDAEGNRFSFPTWFNRDDGTGIAYLRFRPPEQWGDVAESEHVELAGGPGLVLDFNSSGQLIGIEFLDPRHAPPDA